MGEVGLSVTTDGGTGAHWLSARIAAAMTPLLYQELGLPVLERVLTVDEVSNALAAWGLNATYYPKDNSGTTFPGVEIRSVRPMTQVQADRIVSTLLNVAHSISVARQDAGGFTESLAEWGTWTNRPVPTTERLPYVGGPIPPSSIQVTWLEAIQSHRQPVATPQPFWPNLLGDPYRWGLVISPDQTLLPLFRDNGLLMPATLRRARELIICMPWIYRQYDRYYIDATAALSADRPDRVGASQKACRALVWGPPWRMTDVMSSAFNQTWMQLRDAFHRGVSFDEARDPQLRWSMTTSRPRGLIDLNGSPAPIETVPVRGIVFTADGRRRRELLLSVALGFAKKSPRPRGTGQPPDSRDLDATEVGGSIATCLLAVLWAGWGFAGGPGSYHPLVMNAREALGRQFNRHTAWDLATDVVNAIVTTLAPTDAEAVLIELQKRMDEYFNVKGNDWRRTPSLAFSSDAGQALFESYTSFSQKLSVALQRTRIVDAHLSPWDHALCEELLGGTRQLSEFQRGRLLTGGGIAVYLQIAHFLALAAAGRVLTGQPMNLDEFDGLLAPLIAEIPETLCREVNMRARSTFYCEVFKAGQISRDSPLVNEIWLAVNQSGSVQLQAFERLLPPPKELR